MDKSAPMLKTRELVEHMRNETEKAAKIQGEGNNFYKHKQCNSCTTFLKPLTANDRKRLITHLHIHFGEFSQMLSLDIYIRKYVQLYIEQN